MHEVLYVYVCTVIQTVPPIHFSVVFFPYWIISYKLKFTDWSEVQQRMMLIVPPPPGLLGLKQILLYVSQSPTILVIVEIQWVYEFLLQGHHNLRCSWQIFSRTPQNVVSKANFRINPLQNLALETTFSDSHHMFFILRHVVPSLLVNFR